MKKVRKFDLIHANVMKAVLPTLVARDLDEVKAKCKNCENSGRVVGETPDCYACLLNNKKARAGLDNVIDTTPLKDVLAYQDKVSKIADTQNKAKYKLLYEVLESAIYTRMI